jgi:catechol 2,3-dioxygenase-like lactoylglutathione lyase family enzyme
MGESVHLKESAVMPDHIPTGTAHHVALTVSNVDRAREFYTGVLGFQVVRESGQRLVLGNGSIILAVGPAPDSVRALRKDRFDENRVGLDHLSFTVSSRDNLEEAARMLDERGAPRGGIKDLAVLGIYVLRFRDPDNIQLERSGGVAGAAVGEPHRGVHLVRTSVKFVAGRI